jgi:hypothetical protein
MHPRHSEVVLGAAYAAQPPPPSEVVFASTAAESCADESWLDESCVEESTVDESCVDESCADESATVASCDVPASVPLDESTPLASGVGGAAWSGAPESSTGPTELSGTVVPTSGVPVSEASGVLTTATSGCEASGNVMTGVDESPAGVVVTGVDGVDPSGAVAPFGEQHMPTVHVYGSDIPHCVSLVTHSPPRLAH